MRFMEQRAVPAQVTAPPLKPIAAKATTDSLRSTGLRVTRRRRSSALRRSMSAMAAAMTPADVAKAIEPLRRTGGAGQLWRYCCESVKSQKATAEFAPSTRQTCTARRDRTSHAARRPVMRSARRVSRQYQPEVRPA